MCETPAKQFYLEEFSAVRLTASET